MYKTAVYTLVNGIIGCTSKTANTKKVILLSRHWHLGYVMLRNITFLIFAVFDV